MFEKSPHPQGGFLVSSGCLLFAAYGWTVVPLNKTRVQISGRGMYWIIRGECWQRFWQTVGQHDLWAGRAPIRADAEKQRDQQHVRRSSSCVQTQAFCFLHLFDALHTRVLSLSFNYVFGGICHLLLWIDFCCLHDDVPIFLLCFLFFCSLQKTTDSSSFSVNSALHLTEC